MAENKNKSWWGQLFHTGGLIGFSKVIGFLRDLIISAFFGTSYIADAYNFASLITQYPFILFGGLNGPFHSATVATLQRESNQERLKNLFALISFWILIIFIILSGVLFFFIEPIVNMLFSSSSPELINSIILQTRLMIPCLTVTGLIGVLFGGLCYAGNYSLPAVSPLISSLSIIAIILFGYSSLGESVLGIGTSIGVLLQVFLQVLTLKGSGLSLITSFQNLLQLKELKFFGLMLLPAMLSSTVGSLNVYVDMFFCKDLTEGSWTAILLGNRLIQLPFGIFVGGTLVAFLPKISKVAKDINLFRNTINQEIINLTAILVPIAALFLAFSEPIIQIIFQRGAFGMSSTALVASVLLFLALSLITGLPREIVTRAFYGMGDSRTPFLVSLISIGCNILFDWIFVRYFAVGGIALSTTLTALVNSILLIVLLKDRFKLDYGRFILLILLGGITYWLSKVSFNIFNQVNSFSMLNIIPSYLDLGLALKLGLSSAIGLTAYAGLYILLKKRFSQKSD